MVDRLQLAERNLGIIKERFEDIEKDFQALAAVQMTNGRLPDYLARVFPDPEDKDNERARQTSSALGLNQPSSLKRVWAIRRVARCGQLAGSSPDKRTTFPKENGELADHPKHSPNISAQAGIENEQKVKFPKQLRYKGRGQVWATIYKRPHKSQPYRLYWRARVDGTPASRTKDFATYGEAKRAGDKVVADLKKGCQSAVLSPGQASAALVALERLRQFYVDTGRRVTLSEAVSHYCDAAGKLHGKSVGEAVDAFLRTEVTLKRVNLKQAVEQFLAAEEPRTKSSDGKRPEISPRYAYNRAIMLRRFVATFANTDVCDLGKSSLDIFMAGLGKLRSKSHNGRAAISTKSRNHYRAAIRQFLQWAVRNDLLSQTHRLNEADGMRPQKGNGSEILFYTPAEFRALLDAASGPLRAMIAISGLAGLRTAELTRLDWEDLRRVENHIEVSASKAKTRQRRLVEVVPALAQWLALYTDCTGKIWTLHEITFQQQFRDLCGKALVEVKGKKVPLARKPNGLRHSFCTYHFALSGNENLTAQQAGNSPTMLHGNYKGLATKKEAEKWFAVAPVDNT